MGGYVAFAMLRRAAARVSGLVLVGTRAGADTAGRARRSRPHARRCSRARASPAIAREMVPKLLGATTPREQPDRGRRARALIEANSADAIAAAIGALKTRPDSRPLLPTIQCPTVDRRRRGGRDLPRAEAEAMHAAIPGSHAASSCRDRALPNVEGTGLFSTVSPMWGTGLAGLAPIRAKLWKTGPSPMQLQLTEKVAIVTGSSRGLGLASARALAAEGCRVVLCARGAGRAEARPPRSSNRQRPGAAVLAVTADVSTPDGAADRRRRARSRRFGRLDILVNNVGKAGGGDIVSTPDEEWQSALDQTLFPAIRMSRLAVPDMRRAGGGVDPDDRVDLGPRIRRPHDLQRREGRRDQPREGDGAAAREGQHPRQQRRAGLDRCSRAASWWKRQQEDPKGIAEFIRRELPFGRFGRAEEVGAVVAFLASPRASWISGACLTVDGCQSTVEHLTTYLTTNSSNSTQTRALA